MITYNEALDIILKQEDFSICEASNKSGNVAAQTIAISENLPRFDNSAMDGFAVNAEDTKNASEDNLVTLKIAGSSAAGDGISSKAENSQGTGWEIMTGAAVPSSYDAVIKIEDVTSTGSSPDEITINSPVEKGNNIRRAGEDFKKGDAIIKAGEAITPNHVMAFTALGVDEIDIFPHPIITVLSTGKELSPSDAPLEDSQIRDSNSPYILTALAKMNEAPAIYGGSIPDDPKEFKDTLAKILDDGTSIIISTGAVSMGKYDFVPEGLKNMGAKILFHKTLIRPGKPILFARFPNGCFYFGLPGNPIAAAVGLRFFVYPLIRKIQGLPPESFPKAILNTNVKKRSDMRFFQKANVKVDNSCKLQVDILPGQESFRIKPLLHTNCWAILPEGRAELNSGDIVEIAPLYPDQFSL